MPHAHSYCLAKGLKADGQDAGAVEMSSLAGLKELNNTPFRSLRHMGLSGGGSPSTKTQGPVVCSVAPNLPARPPSSSDNDSIRKNPWDYEGLFHLNI